jgi:hypothetical protein
MKATWLNSQQWHNRLKSIETRNMKQYKHTFTVPKIERDLSKCIIETDMDGNICIDYDLYKDLRKTAGI